MARGRLSKEVTALLRRGAVALLLALASWLEGGAKGTEESVDQQEYLLLSKVVRHGLRVIARVGKVDVRNALTVVTPGLAKLVLDGPLNQPSLALGQLASSLDDHLNGQPSTCHRDPHETW